MNRKDFPIFDKQVNGKRFAYLDNAATTHKPQVVIGSNVTPILGVLWMLRHRIKHLLKVCVKKSNHSIKGRWLFEAIDHPINFLI